MAKKPPRPAPHQASSQSRRSSSQALEFGGTFEMDWKGGVFADMAWSAARTVLGEATQKIVERARHHVSPGVGPMPHDTEEERAGIHKGTMFEYEDTGKLHDSITSSVSKKSGFLIASVWSDTAKTGGVPYGMYLELGFHPSDKLNKGRKTGSFYRYPWLSLAYQDVLPEFSDYIPARLRHHLHDTIQRGRSKKSLLLIRPITDTSGTMIQLHRGMRGIEDHLRNLSVYGYDGWTDDDTERMIGQSFQNINK